MKYVYCTDNVLDACDKAVLSCTRECLDLDDRELDDGQSQAQSSCKQSRQSSAMHSPNKMDAERQA